MEMKMSPSEQREERRDEEEQSDIIIIIISSAQTSQQNRLILSEQPTIKANLWIQNCEQNRPELGSEKVLFRSSFQFEKAEKNLEPLNVQPISVVTRSFWRLRLSGPDQNQQLFLGSA